MKMEDTAMLLALGLAIWMVGTIYYAYRGAQVLETSAGQYWLNCLLSAVLSAALCMGILRWRHISHRDWAAAMLLLAIPGMIGEAVVLTHLGTFLPRIREASGGKYGAFLFATYAVVLGIAEVVTLGSRR